MAVAVVASKTLFHWDGIRFVVIMVVFAYARFAITWKMASA